MSAPDGPSNPWQEEKVLPASPPAVPAQPQALSVTTADLSEFDPLVTEGKVQQEAWADEDGHPPAPATPSKDELVPPPSARDAELMSPPKSTSSISFPFVASIARTLARATTPTPRDRGPPPPQEQQQQHQQQQDQHADQTSRQPAKEAPFDFQRFLEQMKMRSAEPVAKYLRSFLSNFSKKSFTVNDQVKVIHNFLSFISEKMREVEPWRNISESEFDNAVEAMEKLVMNKLYDLTFTPQIERTGRSVSTDDLERDHVLEQRIRLFSWVDESNLDVPDGDNVQGFYHFAEQELLKVNHYKAPRDKLICILNSCKVIFGLIRHAHADEGADSFLPILIFVVLRAHPEHLISNVEYINRFRRASKLQSEAGYYLSSLMGAISFIETMDHTSLSNITQEEFEENVETAIQELPPSPEQSHLDLPQTSRAAVDSPMAGEESARPLQLPTPSTIAEDTKRFLQRTGDLAQVAQQTISKPLNAIGRIFNEVLDTAEERLRSQNSSSSLQQQPQQPQYGYGPPGQPWSPDTPQRTDSAHAQQYFPTTYEPRIRGSSPGASPGPGPPPGPMVGRPPVVPSQQQQWAFFQQQQQQLLQQQQQQQHQQFQQQQQQAYYGGDPNAIARTATPALDFGAISHEIERIDAAHRAVYDAAAATLQQIFPTADPEVVEMVLEANDGDLGRSIEALLEMTGVSAASLPPSLVPSPDPQAAEAHLAGSLATQTIHAAVPSDTRPDLRTEPQPYDVPSPPTVSSPTKPASPKVPAAESTRDHTQPAKLSSPTERENAPSTF